jgi:hypothetical protein
MDFEDAAIKTVSYCQHAERSLPNVRQCGKGPGSWDSSSRLPAAATMDG